MKKQLQTMRKNKLLSQDAIMKQIKSYDSHLIDNSEQLKKLNSIYNRTGL